MLNQFLNQLKELCQQLKIIKDKLKNKLTLLHILGNLKAQKEEVTDQRSVPYPPIRRAYLGTLKVQLIPQISVTLMSIFSRRIKQQLGNHWSEKVQVSVK